MKRLNIAGKRVFLLEDDITRIVWFRRHFGPMVQCLDIATEVPTACWLLESQNYDVLFLDHDLVPEHYEAFHHGLIKVDRPPCADALTVASTGSDLAQWMFQRNCQRGAVVIIHSLNPVGAEQMALTLAAWRPFRVPFTVLTESLHE